MHDHLGMPSRYLADNQLECLVIIMIIIILLLLSLLQVDAGMQHSSESQGLPLHVPLARTESSNKNSNPTLVLFQAGASEQSTALHPPRELCLTAVAMFLFARVVHYPQPASNVSLLDCF